MFKKFEPRSDSAKLLWRSVVHLHLTPLFFFRLLFYTVILANILIPAPSTLSAGGHRQPPPPSHFFSSLFPPPFPHPVSQLILVSVIDHIWERLSCSGTVCLKHSQKAGGLFILASRSGSRLLQGRSPFGVEPGTPDTSLVTDNHVHRDEWVLVYFWWPLFQLVCRALSVVPISMLPHPCALNSPGLKLLFLLKTLLWPWIIRGEGLMWAGCSEDSSEM